jgi:hypothetical protein
MLRTTRSALNTQASSSGLLAGEPYLVTDESRIAVGTGTGAYKAAVMEDDITAGTLVLYVKGVRETVFAITDGPSVSLDPANGGIQTWTLGASRTPSASSFLAGQSMLLMVDDGSAQTITWTTAAVTWVGGTAPTLATSGYTCIELWKVGSTLYGAHIGDVA